MSVRVRVSVCCMIVNAYVVLRTHTSEVSLKNVLQKVSGGDMVRGMACDMGVC